MKVFAAGYNLAAVASGEVKQKMQDVHSSLSSLSTPTSLCSAAFQPNK